MILDNLLTRSIIIMTRLSHPNKVHHKGSFGGKAYKSAQAKGAAGTSPCIGCTDGSPTHHLTSTQLTLCQTRVTHPDVSSNQNQHAISDSNFNAVGHTNVDANTHAVTDVVVNAIPLSIFSLDVDVIANAIGNALLFVHPSIFCGVDAGVLFNFEIADGFWFV